MTTETDEEMLARVNAENGAQTGDQRLWGWFGLSRASWLTTPRVLMHEMPPEWQGQMANLLEQFDEAFPSWCNQQLYVTAKKGGKFATLPEALCNYRHPQRGDIEQYRAPWSPKNRKDAAA
jgi:hypothetical protein